MHKSYRVKSGDTLSGIAERELGNATFWPRIYVYNNQDQVVASTGHRMINPNLIRVGQLIMLPPPEPLHHHHSKTALRNGHALRAQLTRPAIVSPTGPAQAAGHAPTASARNHATAPKTPDQHDAGSASNPAAQTQVNSFPLKYNFDVIPEQKLFAPNCQVTLKLQGSVVIWADKQLPLLTFTERGAEIAAKRETNSAFFSLVSQNKVTWDSSKNKVTFENLMTLQARGMPPNIVSSGFVVDSSNPIPAYRIKLSYPKLEGKIGQHVFISENFTVTLDIRPRPEDRDPRQQPRPVLVPVRVPAVQQNSWLEGTKVFVERHGLQIGAGVIIVAAIASNFVTFGADTPIDVPAGALAAGMLRTAAAMAH